MNITIQQVTDHGISRICAVLRIPRSSCYHTAEATAVQSEDVRIGDAVRRIFKKHKRRYGYRRIGSEYTDEKIVCAPAKVRGLMAERGLKAKEPKSYVPRSSDGRADKPSANLLLDQPCLSAQIVSGQETSHISRQARASSISPWSSTCAPTEPSDGAWPTNMRAELTVGALKQTLGSRPKSATCIFHSDRGSQYISKAYRLAMHSAQMRQSMSARANPDHNAWSKSVIGTLKMICCKVADSSIKPMHKTRYSHTSKAIIIPPGNTGLSNTSHLYNLRIKCSLLTKIKTV